MIVLGLGLVSVLFVDGQRWRARQGAQRADRTAWMAAEVAAHVALSGLARSDGAMDWLCSASRVPRARPIDPAKLQGLTPTRIESTTVTPLGHQTAVSVRDGLRIWGMVEVEVTMRTPTGGGDRKLVVRTTWGWRLDGRLGPSRIGIASHPTTWEVRA